MRLLFLVAAHGRVELSRRCLTVLRWTCDVLADHGIRASAIVVADDDNLDTADRLGFGKVRRQNQPLGRKFNDGYQLACDPSFNPAPADVVVPVGSDDWVDPEMILLAPSPGDADVVCFSEGTFVNETRDVAASIRVEYRGGLGIRMIPRALVARTGYRPCAEDRYRAIDTSTLNGLSRAHGRVPNLITADLHPLQIVDWKTPSGNLNQFEECSRWANGYGPVPWDDLAAVYGQAAVDEMRSPMAVAA